jgi:homoserine kinase
MATAVAPGSLSNLGPGFDVLGLALREPLDRVDAERTDAPGMQVTNAGPYGDRVPDDPARNVASWAAQRVLEAAGAEGGLALTVHKHIPPGSGLGSSAASAVAGAVAAARALDWDADPQVLLAIGRDAEALAAGSPHLDNVAPALLGGFVAVLGTRPPDIRSLPLAGDWSLAVVLPDLVVRTAEAREVLPRRVPLGDAIQNLRDLTGLLDAAARGDLAAFCRHLGDQLAQPYRAPLVPWLAGAREAALAAGAPALSISGSGPAVFAPCPDPAAARVVRDAVVAWLDVRGIGSTGWVTGPGPGALDA